MTVLIHYDDIFMGQASQAMRVSVLGTRTGLAWLTWWTGALTGQEMLTWPTLPDMSTKPVSKRPEPLLETKPNPAHVFSKGTRFEMLDRKKHEKATFKKIIEKSRIVLGKLKDHFETLSDLRRVD